MTKGTTRILESDCLKLGTKLYQQAARGIVVNNASCAGAVGAQEVALCMVCGLPLKVYPSYYKEHLARMQKMEELQKLHRQSLAEKRKLSMQQQSNNPLRNISAFGRMAISGKSKAVQFGNGVAASSEPSGDVVAVKEDGGKEEESSSNEIGLTRLSVVGKSKNPFDSDDTPLWKWSELSETLPSIKVFHCRHFYHNDCYRDAQYEPKYNIPFDDEDARDKCLICFSGQRRRSNRR